MKSDINASHPFSKFLKERLNEVLEREDNNTAHVYLYHVNGCWLAFERSAYAACRHFSIPSRKVILFKLKADGRMVVMIGLSDWQKSQMPINVRISAISFCLWKQSIVGWKQKLLLPRDNIIH